MSLKILCVDDERSVLDAYRRTLRTKFTLDTALGGEEALKVLKTQGPFAVVVSDMRMPGMDGVQFLGQVKQCAPNTVRMMLTGNADLQTAIEAVNEGNIFRFLTKPCPPEMLAKSLEAGLQQYRLVMAEKELLEKTLRGSVKVLADVLSLTNPTAFGHASQVRKLMRAICEQMQVDKPWQCEIAAMLSQIGCVTVPTETLDKVYHGQTLKSEEVEMFQQHPTVGRDLVANIPRLEEAAEIIACQNLSFEAADPASDSPAGHDIPIGARILKVALDYNSLKRKGLADTSAVAEIESRKGMYDPEVLKALEAAIGCETKTEIRQVMLDELNTSMTLADDICTENGTIVVSKGQEVTASMRERVRNFARSRPIAQPFRVIVTLKSHAEAELVSGHK